ncbi:MAG: hypothetical protein HC803_08365 [Saprospiraceae bacterium]|nr:hypothetical protein [Saprospiraceae bacterium]
MAQTTITVGTGTSSSYFYGPIYRSSATSSFDWSQYHYLYSAADLAAAGIVPGSTITSLAFEKNSTFVLTGTGNALLDLYLKNSSTAALPASESWTNLTTGSTQVAAYTLNTTNNLPATTGWWTLTLTTPFVYTGGALELSVNWDCSAVSGPSDGAFNWLHGIYSAGTSLGIASGSVITTNLTDGSYGGTERPNTQFTYTAPACAGPTGLNATNILSSTADLGWTASGSATGYNWKIVAAGAGSGATAVASGTTVGTMASATGLTPVTSYDLYVQSDCGGGTLSLYSGPYSFMTGCVNTLSGTYTVGGAGANYADIAAALLDLNTCGVSGAVTFNIAAGTYTGAVSIGQITGSSATNTVTFNGAGAATTTITHGGTGQYATILLDGADYVTFQNLTIANTGTSNAWGVHLMNQANYNTIDNCIINLDQTVTASTLAGVLSSNSTTSTAGYGDNANNTTVSNTTFNGGYYGVRYNGNSTGAAYNTNNSVENCTFNNIYLYSVYWIYQDAPSVKGCTINAHRSTGYAVYSTTNRHMLVEGNTIAPNGYTYAIYFTASNGTAQNATARASIINNMIGATGTADGIYITGSSNFDIFYNSVTAENDQALWLSSTALGYDIRNNILQLQEQHLLIWMQHLRLRMLLITTFIIIQVVVTLRILLRQVI